ncbi:hypothetical protein [Caballeronia sp. LZ043]|nr:hypothetical protein [Caballeronia sp. LZ043]MDR5821188.1 hypothetical protein [Caballeronia sp. LZ043]
MNWLHCEAKPDVPFPQAKVSHESRRGGSGASGTIDPFPHAFAE